MVYGATEFGPLSRLSSPLSTGAVDGWKWFEIDPNYKIQLDKQEPSDDTTTDKSTDEIYELVVLVSSPATTTSSPLSDSFLLVDRFLRNLSLRY